MKLDDTLYLDTITQRLQTFPLCCSATALFGVPRSSHDPHHRHPIRHGLCMEAPGIAKGFTDHISFGSNLKGFLFYYDIHDFTASCARVNYRCFYNQETPKAIYVDFHKRNASGSEEEHPFCSFATKDTADIPDGYILSPETSDGSGTWQTMNTASSYGKIRKETSSDEITIMVEPIGKKVIFSVEGRSVDHAINSMGTLTYLNTDALQAGACRVDFSPSQITLYDQSDQSKPIALFTPIKSMDALGRYESQPAFLEDLAM